MRAAGLGLGLGLGLAVVFTAPAVSREFCPDRPQRASPPCVTGPGQFDVEASLGDWSRSDAPGSRVDELLVGDLLVRTGLGRTVEARLGLTGYGFTRTRSGTDIERSEGVGDLGLGLRWNLAHPDGDGVSVAVQPTVTVPTGGGVIGAGAWSFALALPSSFDLGEGWQLGFSPTVAAAADPDRRGRHLAYAGALEIGHPVTGTLSASAEIYGARDEAPASATRASADVALALKLGRATQLDASAYLGLTPDTPDVEAIVGIAHRF